MGRESKWDFYRGMLIWGVVTGHMITALKCGLDNTIWIHSFLRTYDMPLFAFISGYFLKKTSDVHSFIYGFMRRIETILYPAVLWNLLINLLTQNMSLYLWYLWSIFFCNIIVFSIAKITNKTSIRTFLFVIAIVITHCGIGDRINLGFLLFPCVIGFYYESFERKYFNSKIIKNIVLIGAWVVFNCMLLFWKPEYSVWSVGTNALRDYHTFLLIVYRGLMGITGSIAIMFVYSILLGILKSGKIVETICSWGKATLEIYSLQTIFVEIIGGKTICYLVKRIGTNPFIWNESLLGFAIAPLLSLFALQFLFKVQSILKKLPVIGEYAFRLDIKHE